MGVMPRAVLTEAVKTTSELTNTIDSNTVSLLGAPITTEYNQSWVGVLPLMGVMPRAVLTEAVKTTSELTNKIDSNTVSKLGAPITTVYNQATSWETLPPSLPSTSNPLVHLHPRKNPNYLNIYCCRQC